MLPPAPALVIKSVLLQLMPRVAPARPVRPSDGHPAQPPRALGHRAVRRSAEPRKARKSGWKHKEDIDSARLADPTMRVGAGVWLARARANSADMNLPTAELGPLVLYSLRHPGGVAREKACRDFPPAACDAPLGRPPYPLHPIHHER